MGGLQVALPQYSVLSQKGHTCIVPKKHVLGLSPSLLVYVKESNASNLAELLV